MRKTRNDVAQQLVES